MGKDQRQFAPMRIIRLQAQHFKRLTAVDIKPDGAMVPIAGDNGEGKSSVLDAIFAALAGKKAMQENPVHDGQDVATIQLDLGEITVHRQITRAKDGKDYTQAVVISSPEGARFDEPQKLLDRLIGSLSFDPLKFETAKPEDRFDMVRNLLPNVDFEGTEKANKLDFDERTEINRREKEANIRAEAIVADMGLTGEPINVDELVDQLANVSAHNSEIEARAARRRQAVENIETCRREARGYNARADALRKEIEKLEDEAIKAVDTADRLQEKLDAAAPLPELLNVDDIRAEITQAKAFNEKLAAKGRRLEYWNEAKKFAAQSEDLTNRIEARKRLLELAIAESKFPVRGLSFEGRSVYLNGQPFDQASQAEKLKASIEIAMALNPTIRIIRVTDGARLDSSNMKFLAEIAEAFGFQIWCERVGDTGGPSGIIIEDGHVKGQDPDELLAAVPPAKRGKRR